MWTNGGRRPGSGRKGVKDRKNGSSVAAAIDAIDAACNPAVQRLVEALNATREVPIISGRDENGKCEYTYKEIPDYLSRITSAKIILNKRIADKKTLDNNEKNPIKIILSKEDQKL